MCIVGFIHTPDSAIRSPILGSHLLTPSDSRKLQWMIMSTPASRQFTIDCVDIACPATSFPRRCASSATARSSSRVYDARSGMLPRVVPPLVITLMKLAPFLIIRRTAALTPSMPSASAPIIQQWPPVMVTGFPHATILGPGTMSRLIPSISEKTTLFQPPLSLIVVTPLSRAIRALFTASIRWMSSPSSCTSSTDRPVPGMLVWV